MESNKGLKNNNNCILSLKPVRNVVNGGKNYFNKLTDVLMSYNLLPFLQVKEAKEFGKVNIKFYNAFVRYYERECDSLINKYNIKIDNKYIPKEVYEQKDDKGHFIKLSFSNLEHYLLFSYFDWTWKNDERYWNKISSTNSLLNKDIYKLRAVCWIDLNGNISHIFKGKYKLYLNHCVCNLEENKLKMIILLDGVQLQEFIYPSRAQLNKCRELHPKIEENNNNNEPKAEIRRGPMLRFPRRNKIAQKSNYNPGKKLNKEYIMDINIVYNDKLDNSCGHSLAVKFEKRDDSWKLGWLIDGIILEKVYDNFSI